MEITKMRIKTSVAAATAEPSGRVVKEARKGLRSPGTAHLDRADAGSAGVGAPRGRGAGHWGQPRSVPGLCRRARLEYGKEEPLLQGDAGIQAGQGTLR